MAVRFTCRLIVVKSESGKLRLKYGHLMEGIRLLTLTGPAMLYPPDREFTAEELDRWEFETSCAGYSFLFEAGPVDAPLVEVKRTIEDEIPKGSVRWKIGIVQNEAGQRTFAVELQNNWNQQIPKIKLQVTWRNETPQTHPTAPARMGLQELGGSDSFFHRMTPVGLDALPPGFPVSFAFDPRMLRSLLSRAAALSPERYCVELLTEGHVFDRIPGAELFTVLDELEE